MTLSELAVDSTSSGRLICAVQLLVPAVFLEHVEPGELLRAEGDELVPLGFVLYWFRLGI